MTALGWRELFALADCQGDAVGECDVCHVDGLDLYTLDYSDPASWLYCRACLRKYAQRTRVAERKAVQS